MKTQIVNISLPASLLEAADEQAKQEYRSRSELFREAIRAYILRRQTWNEIFAYGKRQGKKLGVKSEEDVNRLVEEYRQGK